MNPWLIFIFLMISRLSLQADGGVVQFQKDTNGLRITLFSESSPLRAGPTDLSVLVQRTDNAEPVLNANITLLLMCEKRDTDAKADWKPLCCTMDAGSGEITLRPTHQQASNKLLYASPAILPYSGIWNATVLVSHDGKETGVSGTLDVQKPADPWIAYLPYLMLPGFGIGLFALAQKAKRDRKASRSDNL
jgi:hypothetical protein